MPKAFLTRGGLSLLAAVLSHVQSHAEVPVTGTPGPAAVPAQTVSANASSTAPDKAWILPKEYHPWARFEPGSWRELEITTETFDEQGKVFGRSVTTQKEVLKAVADDSYVIDVQATVDVAGKRIAGPWNTRVLRLSTDRPGAVFDTSPIRDDSVYLGGDTIPCQVLEVHYSEDSRNLCDRICFSPILFPHVLRRDTSEQKDSASVAVVPQDVTDVVARGVPFEWEGRMIDCVVQQVVRRREKGNSQSLSLLSPVVPGAEIRAHSTDFDISGKRVRWSVQRLLAFGTTPTTVDREATVTSLPPLNEQK